MTIEEIEKEWHAYGNGIRLLDYSLLDTVIQLIAVAKASKKFLHDVENLGGCLWDRAQLEEYNNQWTLQAALKELEK